MLACVVAALAWTCVLPPVQGPDEDSHVAYAQKVAETRTIPWSESPPADPGLPYSTELAYALTFGAITPSWGNPFARPGRTEADERIWESNAAQLPDGAGGDGGYTPAMRNPPLYYVYEAVPYELASGGSIFDRMFAMRLANLPALLAVVLFTWLIAGELFGGRRWLQALATAAVGLHPQLTHMTAVVNPDVFLAALWTAALYVMTTIVKRGPSRGRVIWLLLLAAASCLTQPRGVAIVVPVGVVAAVVAWRHVRARGPGARRLFAAVVAGGTLVVLLALSYYAVAGDFSLSRVREFGSYAWQFYLPKVAFMETSISPGYGIGELFARFVGGFGMLEATFPMAALRALKVTALVLALLAVAGLIACRADLRRRPGVALVYLAAIAGYLAMMHAVAFRSLLTSADPVITGRHLLPLIPLYGMALALAVAWLPRRWAPVAGGAVLGGALLLQLAGLAVTFERFYA
jgi:hypothetical protein